VPASLINHFGKTRGKKFDKYRVGGFVQESTPKICDRQERLAFAILKKTIQ
jgi:hypothetical protein